MSQVIVTKDQLSPQRDLSAKQEHQISREAQFAKWRRSDITGKDQVLSLIGYAVLPIVALWSSLYFLAAAALIVLKWLFKSLGRIIGGTKSLITGN